MPSAASITIFLFATILGIACSIYLPTLYDATTDSACSLRYDHAKHDGTANKPINLYVSTTGGASCTPAMQHRLIKADLKQRCQQYKERSLSSACLRRNKEGNWTGRWRMIETNTIGTEAMAKKFLCAKDAETVC